MDDSTQSSEKTGGRVYDDEGKDEGEGEECNESNGVGFLVDVDSDNGVERHGCGGP